MPSFVRTLSLLGPRSFNLPFCIDSNKRVAAFPIARACSHCRLQCGDSRHPPNTSLRQVGYLKMQTHLPSTSTDEVSGIINADDDHEEEDPMRGLPRPLILGSASFTRKLILREMGIDFTIVVRPIDESAIGGNRSDGGNEATKLVQTLARAKMDHLFHEIEMGRCNQELPFPVNGTEIASELNEDDDNSSSGSNNKPIPCENQEKDQALASGFIILTADQVVTCRDQILEKPNSVEQAKTFVAGYGSNPCITVGCVMLTHYPSRISVIGLHCATVIFSAERLTPAAAAQLVDDLLLIDKAPILSCAGGLMIEHSRVRHFVDRIDGTEDSVMGLSKDTVRHLLDELRTKLLCVDSTSTKE